MRMRFSLFGLASQFQTDLQTLTCGRFRGGPSISERAVALDRIAGSTLMAGVAVAGFWLVAQTLPLSQIQLPAVADSAHAASAAPSLDLQRLSAEAAAEPLSPGDIRQLAKPAAHDGVQSGRGRRDRGRPHPGRSQPLSRDQDLARVWQVDRGVAADLLN